jgi:hypothetical protein
MGRASKHRYLGGKLARRSGIDVLRRAYYGFAWHVSAPKPFSCAVVSLANGPVAPPFICRSGSHDYGLRQATGFLPHTLQFLEIHMARPLSRARPIGFAALIAILGLAGCVYEDPRYGGYDYSGYGYGGGQSYGNGYPYNDYSYGYRPRPYGYQYNQPYRYQHRHRNQLLRLQPLPMG